MSYDNSIRNTDTNNEDTCHMRRRIHVQYGYE